MSNLIIDLQEAIDNSLASPNNGGGFILTPIEEILDDTDNQFSGTSGNDRISAFKGNDLIMGNAGNDEIYGGKGNDSLNGGDDDDSLWGNLSKYRTLIPTLWGMLI